MSRSSVGTSPRRASPSTTSSSPIY
uniref:Uncharacterized protein n=1 Tax=Arundo donax TaxID=35708 RepID=A0A0A9E468_ARUDO